MNTQTITKPATIFDFFVALPLAEPMCAFSCDYGFDVNENELAEELFAPLPASLEARSIPEINAEEFESRTLWFLS